MAGDNMQSTPSSVGNLRPLVVDVTPVRNATILGMSAMFILGEQESCLGAGGTPKCNSSNPSNPSSEQTLGDYLEDPVSKKKPHRTRENRYLSYTEKAPSKGTRGPRKNNKAKQTTLDEALKTIQMHFTMQGQPLQGRPFGFQPHQMHYNIYPVAGTSSYPGAQGPGCAYNAPLLGLADGARNGQIGSLARFTGQPIN